MNKSVRLANHKNRSVDYDRAYELRQNSVIAERILWYELRLALKPLKVRLRRQHPISPYIVDFACLKFKLVIEIDGESHDARIEYDRRRTNYLNQLGYEVMRFSNQDVLSNCASVVATIYAYLEKFLRSGPRP